MNSHIRGEVSVFNPLCPSRYTLSLLADKWTMLIIIALKYRPLRNGELKRHLGNISQKMLTQTLRSLEANGLVRRTVYDQVPPHVEYDLTELGQSLLMPIRALADWAEQHWDDVTAARDQDVSSASD